jgi:hypothetical protein
VEDLPLPQNCLYERISGVWGAVGNRGREWEPRQQSTPKVLLLPEGDSAL